MQFSSCRSCRSCRNKSLQQEGKEMFLPLRRCSGLWRFLGRVILEDKHNACSAFRLEGTLGILWSKHSWEKPGLEKAAERPYHYTETQREPEISALNLALVGYSARYHLLLNRSLLQDAAQCTKTKICA